MPDSEHVPLAWTPDGQTLLYRRRTADGRTLWLHRRASGEQDRLFAPVPSGKSQIAADFSPDGKWIAYGSNELTASAFLIFVEPFPRTGARYQISSTANSTPVWSRDGRWLYYAYQDRIFATEIRTTPTFTFGQGVELKSLSSIGSSQAVRNFDAGSNGEVMVLFPPSVVDSVSRAMSRRVMVIANWFDELNLRAPPR